MRSKLTIKTPEQIFNNPKICFQEWKQEVVDDLGVCVLNLKIV